MIKLIKMPWVWVCWLWGLAFPMWSSEAAKEEKAYPIARWFGRLVLLIAVLLVLWLINNASMVRLFNVISHPLLKKIWLPVFGLCMYVLLWLGWWLYRILSLDIADEKSEFPDIDSAWDQAMKALAKEDIRLDATPLFLILGWNASSEEVLYEAGGIKAKVHQIPKERSEPLHVTADRDSIWLTCPGTSLLAQQNPAIVGSDASDGPMNTIAAPGADPFGTMALQGFRKEDLVANAKSILAGEERVGARKSIRTDDREEYSARLRHLCRLIKRDRLGFCPINGILLMVPVSAADPKNRPEEFAEACRSDLTEIFEVFQMRCPVIAMVPDLERVDGFTDLVEKLPEAQRGKRIGQRFPLVTDLSEGEFPAKIESSVDWTVSNLLGTMVYSLFQVEASRGMDEVGEVLRGNQQLYRFLGRIRQRRDPLARLIRQCIPRLAGDRLMFGGCYFSGTGQDRSREQAFASGVLVRMIQEQDNVTWTEDAVREDAAYHRRARTTRIFLGLLVALLIAVILGLIGFRWSRGGAPVKPPA